VALLAFIVARVLLTRRLRPIPPPEPRSWLSWVSRLAEAVRLTTYQFLMTGQIG